MRTCSSLYQSVSCLCNTASDPKVWLQVELFLKDRVFPFYPLYEEKAGKDMRLLCLLSPRSWRVLEK